MRCPQSAAPVACRAVTVIAAVAVTALAAGCGGGAPRHAATGSSPGPSQLAAPRQTCGTSRTAVNVPVTVEVERGSASCPLAMRIQTSYTGLVRSGRVPGNGGGAPVKVDGWTCQGTDTTTTVQTGEASSCRRGSTEIIAVLKLKGSGSGS